MAIFTIMIDLSHADGQVRCVTNFQELVGTPFSGRVNALCWERTLQGDFSEIVSKVQLDGNITAIERDDLLALQLSEAGKLAREIILNDFQLLEEYGAMPSLNVINYYERDVDFPFFPTDVYSFHVDRSPIATDTFLCTYEGDASEILPNAQGEQKILIPEIRAELRKLYDGPDAGFAAFLSEHFFDLHYQAKEHARTVNLGVGHLWRLACDHPGSDVPPCLHRAPEEKSGKARLLMIC